MNILLLGGAGYVGRVLVEHLHEAGHRLSVVDLFNFSRPADMTAIANVRVGDTRELVAADFAGIDAVLDLAAISNDPSGELNPNLTREVNCEARIRAATLAKSAGVRRYVLFSSCSVYGANDSVVDETAPLNPLTEYAASNARAEAGVLALCDDTFCASAFRLATVFGLSPSMRFDLVVNTMTLSVFETGRLTISGGGEQYRPLIHVADIAEAASKLIAAPTATVNGQRLNIGHANLQMQDVGAAVVRGVNRPVDVVLNTDNIDQRNYRVDAAKAEAILGFVARRTIEEAVTEIFEALASGKLKPTPATIRLNGYREMVARLVS